jgi:hypothetical protein
VPIAEINHKIKLMLAKLSWLLSALLHPLLLPTLASLLLLYVLSPSGFIINVSVKPFLVLIIFILTFLLPMTGILIYYWGNNSLSKLAMQSRQERLIPFALTTIAYILSTFFLSYSPIVKAFPLIVSLLASISLTLALITIITIYWKISAHSTGIAGIVGFLLGIAYKYAEPTLLMPTLAIVLLAGLLMTARLYLDAHTPAQIGAGAYLGFVIQFIAVLLLS